MRCSATPVDARFVTPQLVGHLVLRDADDDGRRFVAAASGITAVNGRAWVAADDCRQLAAFSSLATRGLLASGLPRREHRYDFESICAVRDAHQGASVLVLGSGTKSRYEHGLLQRVDDAGRATGAPTELDLHDLYDALRTQLGGVLNIEGSAARDTRDGHELLLLHRGNGPASDRNAVIRLDRDAILRAARAGEPAPASAIRSIQRVDLGSVHGERLTFSDAHALADGSVAFAASAERTDGTVAGAAVGILGPDLALRVVRPLDGPPRKPEGIVPARELDPLAPVDRFVLVTDADDPSAPADVLQVDLRTGSGEPA